MQRKVLDYLYLQGGITLLALPGQDEVSSEALQRFALALNAGARFVVLDYSGILSDSEYASNRYSANYLQETPLNEEDFQYIQETSHLVFTRAGDPSDSEEGLRVLFHNLEFLKKQVSQILIILPREYQGDFEKHLHTIARLLIVSGKDVNEASSYLEDSISDKTPPLLWLLDKAPERKRFRKSYKSYKNSFSALKEVKKLRLENNPEDLAKVVIKLHKAEILKKNPLDGFPKLFRSLFPLFLLAVIILPFIHTTKVEPSISAMRDRIKERNRLSVAPSFDYTFDGKESLHRISRYAIGRFNALVTTPSMVDKYMKTTMEENGYKSASWFKGEGSYPPAGTVVKFSRPDYLDKTASDSIGAAWKYWTTIVSDSISYITELYYPKATANNRQHNGIDLASRQGARILAPFAAKAYTRRDERGGVIIGLVREKDVILFMHCDQLLYLDGQEVMQGDPIATVGTTGHTTGPHAHVVTGVVNKRGAKHIGNVRYDIIDPMTWYYKFKPSILQ